MIKDIPKCLNCKNYDKYAIGFSCKKYENIPDEIIDGEEDCEFYEEKDEKDV